MIKLDKENFDEVIKKGRVLVDFYADWCGPCRMLAPVLEEISNENIIKIVKVNVDNHEDIARRYGVMSIPTLVLFENGNEQKRNTGFIPREAVEDFIKEQKNKN